MKYLSGLIITMILSALMSFSAFAAENSFTLNGHTYTMYENGLTWDQAESFCENKGGYLATITSQEEQDKISELILNYGTKKNYWLGGYEVTEGEYTWVTGEKFSYTNWTEGSPDNNQGLEDRLMMWHYGGWNDCRADGEWLDSPDYGLSNFGFICEEEIQTNIVTLNGHTYILYEDGMTWTEAEKYCEKKGGHLATITSQEEQDILKNLVEKIGNKKNYWLGGYEVTEGNYTWVTGETLSYANWTEGSPDNNQGLEDRIMMWHYGGWNDCREDGEWLDSPDYGVKNFGFICEIDNYNVNYKNTVTTENTTETTTEKVTQATTQKQTQATTKSQQTTKSTVPNSNTGNTKTQTIPFTQTSSPWAQKEMEEANEKGLIPQVLINKDLRENVSRAEFASIAVTLYEELSGNKLSGGTALPFNDVAGTENIADIQKAYGAGIAVGTSSNTFAPNTSINREQLVTMLCRSIKKYRYPEWTIATDSDYLMTSGGVSKKFADDADISDFARDSVYFMSNMGIVKGIDDTHFAPKAVTNEQVANGYAIATREQAIAISLRIFKRSDMM